MTVYLRHHGITANSSRCDTLFKTESDEIKHLEKKTLSGRTSPLRSHRGIHPPGQVTTYSKYVQMKLIIDNNVRLGVERVLTL